MKTYRLYRDELCFAFEIENAYIRPKAIVKILDDTNDVSNVEMCKPFDLSSDVRVKFQYKNIGFVVWEPYGDSSRYWIGPEQENDVIDICQLESAFKGYHPSMICKILGDVVTLNFMKILFQKD